MDERTPVRYTMQPGLTLTMILIGLMLLNATLYYRAVKFQRFSEPVLAVIQPKVNLSSILHRLLLSEFKGEDIKNISLRGDSIFIRGPLVNEEGHLQNSAIIRKIARVFLSLLKDDASRHDIGLIIVGPIAPISNDQEVNKQRRAKLRERAGVILNSIFKEEPDLEKNYLMYFSPSVISSPIPAPVMDIIEFRIVPSQTMHIDVLMKLQKYAQ